MNKYIFIGCFLVAASGIVSPPIALLGGLAFGLTFANPFPGVSKWGSRFLLQASVVMLGFGMNLHEIAQAGRSGFIYTAVGITASLLLGLGIGALMRVGGKASYLISAGTAICGGSAIAAVGPITGASDEEMAVSLGTIFVLNSVALFLFPWVGGTLHMSETQFGLWSALAIHDTSSVVGATAKYGPVALAVGTTIKLTRALWIVPLALVTAAWMKSKAKIQWPWFVLFFVLAALANSLLPRMGGVFAVLNHAGRLGLTATLFLIGTNLTKETLRRVGARPLVQGFTLWIIVATSTLFLIFRNWIHL
jgi:uncharacterized integral membrane protein (TIGR00698 family)